MIALAVCPNMAPTVAPMNKAGEKTPPEPPEPSVRHVDTYFIKNKSPKKTGSVSDERRMSMIVA